MQTYQIHVGNARETVHEIRRELFVFPEVLEVYETGHPEILVVVFDGRPRPGEWLRALRAVGYRTPARQRSRFPLRPTPPEPPIGRAGSNGSVGRGR